MGIMPHFHGGAVGAVSVVSVVRYFEVLFSWWRCRRDLTNMATRNRRRRLALLYTYLNLLKYEEKRWWVRPIYQNRKQQGDYYNLLQEMRLTDTESYFNYMRMTQANFDELLNIVGPLLQKKTLIREPIQPGQRLALTIRHLAAGDSISTLSYSYRIGKTTVSKIIIETTEAIWTSLKDVVFMTATEENWKKIAHDFYKNWNFPNCIGAIDGKHVAMQAPNNMGSEFYNYKDFHSIVLLGICDANYRFSVVDIGASGRQSDGGILKNSIFFKRLLNGTLNVPSEELLPNTNIKTPYVLVGDEAFPLTPFLMRPYPGRNTNILPADVRVYNYRLSRARRVIENTFGILVSRWRIFRRAIIGKVTTVENIVKATTCLHNWLQQKNNELRMDDRKYCPPNYTDREDLNNGEMIPGEWRNDANNSLSSMGRASTNMYSNNAASIRETLKKYFFHEGSVPWQWNICNVNMNDDEINTCNN